MFRSLKITLLLAVALFSCERHSQGGGASSGDNSADSGDLRVVWETPQKITTGGYPRVHRLNDGRLMMTFSDSFDGYAIFSNDNGKTWKTSVRKCPMSQFEATNGTAKALVSVAVPDFAQLSSNHPHHPGRIIFAGDCLDILSALCIANGE